MAAINYRKRPDWEKKVLELTDGKGVDQLLDVVGGDGLNQSVEATRVAGQIFQIGFLRGQTAKVISCESSSGKQRSVGLRSVQLVPLSA
jgi:NADPH:quinone reductase-like Zn-dependent oxidoreductase